MSLGINTTTPEGIVLAADSRQSYRNRKGTSRIGSDSASKVYKLGSRAGLVVAGLAFLPEKGVQKNISRFIDEFKNQADIEELTIDELSRQLKIFFESKYNFREQLDLLPDQITADLKKQGCEVISIEKQESKIVFTFRDPEANIKQGAAVVDQLQFIVAGYNADGNHQVCMVYIPGTHEVKRDGKVTGNEYGASWIGQTDVVARIVLGYDGRIGNLNFMQKVLREAAAPVVQQQLGGLEYVIQWGTMTLQDGIDFSLLAIETTTAIQRFSDGIKADPGDVPGVGGPIDIAVITPEKGFIWVSKKRLSAGTVEIDIETLPDVKDERIPGVADGSNITDFPAPSKVKIDRRIMPKKTKTKKTPTK